MEGQDGSQNEHLILANKIFLLTHPDVQDIEKVQLKDDVLSSAKSDCKFSFESIPNFLLFCSQLLLIYCVYCFNCIAAMAFLYETLATNGVLDLDQSVLDSMRQSIDDELKKLDEK